MKKFNLLLVLILYVVVVNAQETTEEGEGVDLLKAPTSPAAQLLNFAPNSIERPTDLSSFWLSINNATSKFTQFPTSYAVDFLPASLFRSRYITLVDLKSTNAGQIFWQTLNFSFGYKSEEDSITQKTFTRSAIGVKFSIVRPEWTSETETKYKRLSYLQSRITKQVVVIEEEIENNPAYAKKIKEREKIFSERGDDNDDFRKVDKEIEVMKDSLLENLRIEKIVKNNADYTELKKSAREFSIEREGPFLDFAGGFAVRFPTNDLAYSFAEKAGTWVTGGYEGGNNSLSIYGVARYLYQPEKIFADTTNSISSKNISTLDMGVRVLYATKEDKFNLSFESIYRSVLNKSIVDPSWRLVFSAEYDLGFNQKLTFNFGRDYNGVISKDGNLIAALNFIAGFGNKRKIGAD
jgi:hypothetical protein